MIDAAAAAGVRRIVKLSTSDAAIGSPSAFADAHARIEAHLRASGVDHVLLKPTFKMTNLWPRPRACSRRERSSSRGRGRRSP